PTPATLWCADERTLVVGLTAADVAKLERATGAEALAEPVRALLQERVGPGGPIWLAGHVERWDQGIPLLARGALGKDNGELLAKLRSLAAWAEVERGVTARVVAEAASPAGALDLEKRLGPARERDPEGLRVAREGAWLTLQYRTDMAGLRRVLSR